MKIPHIHTKDLTAVTDLSVEEIYSLFKCTHTLKKMQRKRKKHHILKNKTLAMIFEKSSTRTRVSFESGIYQLGGHGLFLSNNDIQIGRGESLADTAKVLSRYVDGIMIRTFDQENVRELAKYASIPVINGLTDLYHPCQALTDYFTIYEQGDILHNIKLAYIGDGNNMAHSLLLCGAMLGVDVSIASPKMYQPDKAVVNQAMQIAEKTNAIIEITTDIAQATLNAHYVYTDVWASMGKEKEAKKRHRAFAKYKVTLEILQNYAPHAKVMHCLPAHRGEEIDDDVIESSHSIIFDQAENRLHVQKALLCLLMK